MPITESVLSKGSTVVSASRETKYLPLGVLLTVALMRRPFNLLAIGKTNPTKLGELKSIAFNADMRKLIILLEIGSIGLNPAVFLFKAWVGILFLEKFIKSSTKIFVKKTARHERQLLSTKESILLIPYTPLNTLRIGKSFACFLIRFIP